MKAAQERAFDEQAAATGRALWPGRIQMGGVTYTVSATRNPVQIQFMDGDAAGTRELAGLQVELRKSDHPDEPEPDTVVADLDDGGRLYKIARVGGRMATDSVWYLECTTEDRA